MKAMRNLLTVLVFSVASAVHGGEFDDILAKAKEGDVVAQIQAAEMYSKGQGVAKNSNEAVGWYQKAADQGNADAQLSLGNLYLGGKGIPKNSAEAAKWFTSSPQRRDGWTRRSKLQECTCPGRAW